MLLRSESQSLTSSPVRAESRRSGLSWTEAESQIRSLHVSALDDLDEDESRRLYQLEMSASRHAGTSPRVLLEKAKRVVGAGQDPPSSQTLRSLLQAPDLHQCNSPTSPTHSSAKASCSLT